MNKLSIQKRAQTLGCLVEGNSIRSTVRMSGVAKNTVTKLLVDVGRACCEYQDKVLRNLPCMRIQCDKFWAFCYAKEKNVPEEKRGQFGYGDVWTWTAICADSKLVPSFMVGNRNAEMARAFMEDLASRLSHRVQFATDGLRAYLDAVVGAFGIKGNPDEAHISTSYVEQQNLTMRMSTRRFTRLTNDFSKKIDSLAYAVSLHFMYYNFGRIHRTLRVTPAMESRVSDHVWSLEEKGQLNE